MDFDDLDDLEPVEITYGEDEIKALKKAGKDVNLEEATVVKKHPLAPGKYNPYDYLPKIPRNYRLPDFDRIPEKLLAVLPDHPPRTKVLLRVFIFYGAGDTWNAWAQFAINVPAYVECVVLEWPSHGCRDEEEMHDNLARLTNDSYRSIRQALEMHCKKGLIEGAPFAFVGHSIGCQVATTVAAKVREELGLEPAVVFMLDRAPPHLPLHSEKGCKLRDDDPWEFMKWYNRQIHDIAKNTEERKPGVGQRQVDMWVNDVRIASDVRDCTAGFHKFDCPLYVMRALGNYGMQAMKESDDPKIVEQFNRREELMGSPPGWGTDFSPEQFEEWKEYVGPNGQFHLIDCADCGHVNIKADKFTLDVMDKVFQSVKAPVPKNPPT